VARELELDSEKTNVNGGAIAITHPLAASGARITISLLHELRRRGGRYGLGAACIGGGQGMAVVVEALSQSKEVP
jgi:acetyl-CoA acyltransferase 2